MLPATSILVFFFFLLTTSPPSIGATFNLSLPHQHPNPEAVVEELQRRVNESIFRREIFSLSDQNQCFTGNPIDDCWRCYPNWESNRQELAGCGVGFGRDAMGGKSGRIYLVTDSSDRDTANPTPGTFRHAVSQTEPLWITFAGDMVIFLRDEVFVKSYKTIDGRGAKVEFTGSGCIIVKDSSNVIIHNIHIYNCKPTVYSDGDGISISGSHDIWIDHCTLSDCSDGLIDVTLGSTAVTLSNNFFFHHDKAMLFGHDDTYTADAGMQVTLGFNKFGEGLEQRIPRIRHGYVHLVNNDYTGWGLYAIGGSASPTVNSQGNRYTAPSDPTVKEVTRRIDTNNWANWNWRSDGDVMVNGAFFVPSGKWIAAEYDKASSIPPKAAAQIDELTKNAGVLYGPGLNGNSGGGSESPSHSASPASSPTATTTIFMSLLIILICTLSPIMVL